MRRFQRLLLAGAALALLAAAMPVRTAHAQATTGELTGRILDADGAVLPGVTVTLQNDATGFTRTTTTNDAGEYTFALLPPGRYRVSAELSNFRRVVREDVLVSVGTRHTLPLTLEIGDLTESVIVTGESPLIETTRSDLGGVVTPKEITIFRCSTARSPISRW